MFSLPYLDTSALSKIGVWEEGGEIVAVVTYEADTGVAWFLTEQIAAAHGLTPTRDKQPNTALDLTGDPPRRSRSAEPACPVRTSTAT